MVKKESLVIVGCVILFIVLIVLLYLEMKYPEGGVTFVAKAMAKLFGE